MGFRVRPATGGDSAAVVEVVRAVYDEFGFTWEAEGYHADLYDLKSHYLSAGHAFFVSESDEGKVVGSAALKIFAPIAGGLGEPSELNGKRRIGGCDCSLDRLYVLPDMRRSGIGSALFEAVLEEARSRKRRAMEIWSDKRFVDAHRLYGRMGAKSITDRILDDPDQSPEWGLLLIL
jgi:GNAT superfamily N-acetyltransferase